MQILPCFVLVFAVPQWHKTVKQQENIWRFGRRCVFSCSMRLPGADCATVTQDGQPFQYGGSFGFSCSLAEHLFVISKIFSPCVTVAHGENRSNSQKTCTMVHVPVVSRWHNVPLPPLCAMAVSRNYTAIHNPSLNLCHRVTHLSKSRCQRCRWKPASCRGAPSRNGRQIFFFCQPPHVCATVAQHTAALPTAEKCGNILH